MAALQRERLDDGIEVVRLDRPQARNALDSAALAELEAALAELAADDELRVLVVSTTSTRALCAGADVAEVLDRAGGVARMEAFARVYAAVEAFPAPTVCVCVGNVVGAGAEIAAGCDLRVGATTSSSRGPARGSACPVGPGAADAAGRARRRQGARLHRPHAGHGGGARARAAAPHGAGRATRRPPPSRWRASSPPTRRRGCAASRRCSAS